MNPGRRLPGTLGGPEGPPNCGFGWHVRFSRCCLPSELSGLLDPETGWQRRPEGVRVGLGAPSPAGGLWAPDCRLRRSPSSSAPGSLSSGFRRLGFRFSTQELRLFWVLGRRNVIRRDIEGLGFAT